MLKEILSISGKPGLYKQISQGKNMIIVESLSDGKRMPTFLRDKVVSLGDIQIFTNTGEIAFKYLKTSARKRMLRFVLCHKADNDTLRNYMQEVLPEYDQDRVYPSDMRKIYGIIFD